MNNGTYEIKRARRNAKHMSVRVLPGGKTVVSVPPYTSLQQVLQFVQERAQWITRAQKTMRTLRVIPSGRRAYTIHKERAREIITKRVHELNKQYYKFRFNRIAIKNTKSSWGSCSEYKNLNFHFGLIFLPQRLMDYIILHELCHLKEMNHGPKFWGLVEKSCPHYKQLREEIKKYQHSS